MEYLLYRKCVIDLESLRVQIRSGTTTEAELFELFRHKSVISFNGRYWGLGNRVRGVLGARMLADFEGRDFYYVWPTGSKFGPKLTDLWRFDGRPLHWPLSKLLSVRYPYLNETLDWLDDDRRQAHIWQLKTGHALHLPAGTRSWQDGFRSLQPVPEIAARVQHCFDAELAGRPYVGVMIRAHAASHTKTIEHSPVSWYTDRMLAIRRDAPDVQFFVSCDVPEVADRVRAEIGGCHVLTDKGEYNTVKGVRSAVADLYLLASSSYLLGPHYSSFVELAQSLAGSGLTLETSMKPADHPIDLATLGLPGDPLRPQVRTPADTA